MRRPRLGSIWRWAVILLLSVFFAVASIATSWVPPRGRFYLLWARRWAHWLMFLTGVPARIEVSDGAEKVPQAIFMSNHESGIDILLLFVALRQEVRFLAKRSLFFLPFIGWSMWLAGFVPVDRKRRERARDVFETLAKRIRKGNSIIVFPEGTRSRDGSLGAFKKSGFLLALQTGLPIVPVGVSGARAVLGADGLFIHPGLVAIRVGDPIPTAGLSVGHRRALMERVRKEILRLRG